MIDDYFVLVVFGDDPDDVPVYVLDTVRLDTMVLGPFLVVLGLV